MTAEQTRPTLPKSLQKRRFRKILFRASCCSVLFALVLVSIILWGERIFPFSTTYVTGLRFLCYFLFLLLPFFVLPK